MPLDPAFLASLVNDDGTNTLGTQINIALFTALVAAINAAPLHSSAYNNAVQSINSATWTVLTLNSEDFDDGFHSTSVNTSRQTVPTGGAGGYFIRAKTNIATHATGVLRGLSIYKNGAAVKYLAQPVNNPVAADFQITDLEVLAVADYIEVAAYQDSGGALNVGAATRPQATELQLVRLW